MSVEFWIGRHDYEWLEGVFTTMHVETKVGYHLCLKCCKSDS